MAYQTQWYIENEIVLMKFSGEVTADDLRNALKETQVLIDQSSREPVHIFSDIRQVTYPLKMQESMKIVREFKREDASGWEITIGQLDVMTKFGLMIARSVLRQNAISFPTLDEAIAHLKEQDPNIHWEKADTMLIK